MSIKSSGGVLFISFCHNLLTRIYNSREIWDFVIFPGQFLTLMANEVSYVTHHKNTTIESKEDADASIYRAVLLSGFFTYKD